MKITENTIHVKIEWLNSNVRPYMCEEFLVDKNDWEILRPKIVGSTLNFGEIYGKHSEVYDEIFNEEVTECNDIKFIKKFNRKYPYGTCINEHSFLENILENYFLTLEDCNDEDGEITNFSKILNQEDLEIFKRNFKYLYDNVSFFYK